MGLRLLIKGRAEDEMWNGGRGRLKRSMRRQEGRTRTEELRNKTSDGTQKRKKRKKKTARNRATTWLSTCRATLLLPLATSSRTFLLLPVFFCSPLLISLCLSGTRTCSSPSHYHSSSGTLAVDAAVNSHVLPPRHPCSSAELVRSRLLPYTGKVVRPFPERWWTEEGGGGGGQRTGEGSIWLVNFNVGADVPLCVLVRSVGWKKHHAMIIWGNICSFYRLEAAALTLHIWPAVLVERDLSFSDTVAFIIMILKAYLIFHLSYPLLIPKGKT